MLSLGTTLGVSIGNMGIPSSISPTIGLGIGFGSPHGINFIAFLPSLGTFAPILGIGFIEPEKYSLEANLVLPSLTTLGGGQPNFGFQIGASTYIGRFGASFTAATSYVLGSSFSLTPLFGCGLRIRATQKINMTIAVTQAGVGTVNAVFGF